MKKCRYIITFYFIIAFMLYAVDFTKVNAEENYEYQTFPEIIMSDGKLLKNFTNEEIVECLKHVEGITFWGINVYLENSNVPATYISNTLFSVDNSSYTDLTYNVDVEVVTNNKVTVKLNGDVSSKFAIPVDKIKAEIGNKAGVEVSNVTEVTRKEKRSMKVVVEANSRAIMYLTGQVTVTNGAVAIYLGFVRVAEGCFELAVLNNQYTRIEKSKIC